MNDRVLMEMKIGGVKCKRAIPTIEVLTNKKYGFSTSWEADKNRIVKPFITHCSKGSASVIGLGNGVYLFKSVFFHGGSFNHKSPV